jgi:hypothetical protein
MKVKSCRQSFCARAPIARVDGGRSWLAHFEFTRTNIEQIIRRKKIEDLREVGASILAADHHSTKRPSSLVAERIERIEVRCSPRRQIRREHCCRNQGKAGHRDRPRILRTDAKE